MKAKLIHNMTKFLTISNNCKIKNNFYNYLIISELYLIKQNKKIVLTS